MWERQSRAYDRRFRRVLSGSRAAAWGLWRVPERSLRLLPPVRRRATLEVGCGAARWSVALARKGAHPVGLDFSRVQLAQARREVARSQAAVALVQGSAERIPFDDATFDLVFCDWGALTFADPARTIPECARVLRPAGHLVFASASPIALIARDLRRDRLTRRLRRDYFGLHRIEFPDEVNFQLPYGEWVALFARCGLTVERLVETRPPARARSAYLSRAEEQWAQRWPMECLWRVRKEGSRVTEGERGAAGSVRWPPPGGRRGSRAGRARSPPSTRSR